jgi:CubicO group peptidase (beta-lactamase class C family)
MNAVSRVSAVAVLAVISLVAAPAPIRGQDVSTPDLAGLWYAKDRFGPDVRGRLVIDRTAAGWRASIAGRTAPVRFAKGNVSFRLPDGSGSFAGGFDARRRTLAGHWIQPKTLLNGEEVASPVWMSSCGESCFAGDVVPLDDRYTLYVKVTKRPDGTLGAFIRNPERNIGRFIRLDRIEADGRNVRWLDAHGTVINEGVVRDGVMSVYIGERGGSYDFRRVPDGAFTYFYPRGRPTAPYRYAPPRAQNDGWPVGTPDEVGMSRGKISELMRAIINTPIDRVGSHEVHGILIARHGKLVAEEYFFGQHGDEPHETRSAAKTVTSVLAGALMQAGVKIGPASSVYSVMRPHAHDLEPRKRALTLEHLLNMSSGLDCDDWSDEPQPPGSEDVFTNQDKNPDWYRLILDLRMVRDPGTKFVYCSANAHLAGGMLSRAAGRWLPDLTRDLIAEPLGIRRYYIPLTPKRDAYTGGGWYWRPRDFMKLGQLYLNGGTWHGRRVVSKSWIQRSTQPRFTIGKGFRYGYLWWHRRYPYAGRTVDAYFASGNGGQTVMVVPELDLVFAAYGANYNDGKTNWKTTIEYVPRYVLAAVTRQR